MARKLQIKRGVLSDLPTLSEGEFGFTTDTKTLYIGHANGNVELTSADDKNKLDNIEAGANKYVLPGATSTTLGGVTTNDFISPSQKGVANGIASLGSDGKVLSTQLPNTTYTIIEKNTVFNSDGSITETDADENTIVTTFNSDGSITEVYTINGVSTTKKTTFNSDGSISEVIL